MKTLTSFFTLLFAVAVYGAVPLGTVPYAQLDTNDFGVTAVGHVNTRLSIHTPNTPGDTYYLTINGTNINNGGTNFLQSLNPTAWTLPVRGADTNFVDSLLRQDATGLHMGTNFAAIIDFFGYPALTLGDTGGANTYLTLYPDGLFLKDHFGNALNLYGQTANIGGLIYAKSIMQIGTMWGKVELADDNPAHTAKFQPTLPMGTSHTTLGSSTNAWEGIYAGSTKQFQFFDVVIDPGVSTNLNFAVDGVTYNIGAGGGSVGGTTINSLDNYLPVRLNAGAFDNSPLYTTGGNIATDSRIIFGPGVTNWISRIGSSLIYSNNAASGSPVSIIVENGPGNQAQFGTDQNGHGFLRSDSGKWIKLGVNGDAQDYMFTPNGFYCVDGQQALGSATNNWAELRLGTNNLWGSYTDDGTQLLRNGIPLAGATVTYAAVTNALGWTGSATDVQFMDGHIGPAGGGSGNVVNTGASVVGMVPVYTSITGTAVTPTNSLTLTGTLTVTNAAPLTTPALEVFGGERHASFYTLTNYTASVTNYSITLGGACTNTLMSAASVGEGFWLHVKALAGGGEIWVQNGDFMDNVTNLVLAPWSARSFKSDGTNTWEIH